MLRVAPPDGRRVRTPIACALLVGLLSAGGCGAPPALRVPGSTSPAVRGTPTAAPTAAPLPTPTPTPTPVVPGPVPSATGYPEDTAVHCHSGPAPRGILRLLRGSSGPLSGGATAKVTTGPLCAGGWQYTVVRVSGHEPLQVVTESRSASLRLVTAGTDVCTIEVRISAPAGIRALACEAAPVASPGA